MRKLNDVIPTLPQKRQQRVETRAMELATLQDLTHATKVSHSGKTPNTKRPTSKNAGLFSIWLG
jgi:hypothetical protein